MDLAGRQPGRRPRDYWPDSPIRVGGCVMTCDEWPELNQIDWDEELALLSQDEMLVETAERSVRRLVDQWFKLRAGDAMNFDAMPADLGLRPDDQIGAIVVDLFARSICDSIGVEFDELDEPQTAGLNETILDCITQGVAIGLGAISEESQ